MSDLRVYGNLLFDLCESVLWNPLQAQATCRNILNQISKRIHLKKYHSFERSWVLKIAYQTLSKQARLNERSFSSETFPPFHAGNEISEIFKPFQSYFHRLSLTEQILLILKERYDIPYSEISAALNIPEGSLKIMRQQALKTLEEWLWKNQ